MRKILLLALFLFAFLSCSTVKTNDTTNYNPKFRLLNSIEIPFNQEFKNTVIGGLSSVDYDTKNDLYYFISDDRSIYNGARFYTAKIHLGINKMDSIAFQNIVYLKNTAGEKYSNWEKQPDTSIDPEELRYNPKTNTVVWSSEGARVIAKDFSVLQNPSIQTADVDGNFFNAFDLPANLNMQKEEKGPRSNGVLEGITFNKNYTTLYTNIEEPLYEDDTEASLTKGALIRLYAFDVKSKNNTAQFAYELDPIAHAPNPKDGFAVNGVSAIQYYGKNQLLVVERSYSVGKQACTIKVYLCDFSKATDIKDMASLQNQEFTPATKKLILNMDDLGIFIDNIEGITFGPKLANGKQSLLFVSDNNFSEKQITQVLLFEVD
jgi:hypothetical protein